MSIRAPVSELQVPAGPAPPGARAPVSLPRCILGAVVFLRSWAGLRAWERRSGRGSRRGGRGPSSSRAGVRVGCGSPCGSGSPGGVGVGSPGGGGSPGGAGVPAGPVSSWPGLEGGAVSQCSGELLAGPCAQAAPGQGSGLSGSGARHRIAAGGACGAVRGSGSCYFCEPGRLSLSRMEPLGARKQGRAHV